MWRSLSTAWTEYQAVTWLWRLVLVFLRQRSEDRYSGHVGIVVDRMQFWQVLFGHFRFTCKFWLHWLLHTPVRSTWGGYQRTRSTPSRPTPRTEEMKSGLVTSPFQGHYGRFMRRMRTRDICPLRLRSPGTKLRDFLDQWSSIWGTSARGGKW
jgi:hypothetical protein